jgi:hypothetical protein
MRRARTSSRTRCPARSGSGPDPRMITFGPVGRARPRSPRRRWSSGRACGRRTRPRRCPRSCRPARTPSACRTPRTTSSPACRRSAAICRRTARPLGPAQQRSSSTGAADDLPPPRSSTSAIWSRNHGSMPVARGHLGDRRAPAAPAARDEPPVVGGAQPGRERLGPLAAGRAGSAEAQPPTSPFSSDRIALFSASAKVRPMAIASPTDFIVVVVSWGRRPGTSRTRTAAP